MLVSFSFLVIIVLSCFFSACDSVECNFYAVCVDNGQGLTTCECPSSCGSVSVQKICGNDGQTYLNDCEMTKTSCQQGKLVTKAYDGSCGTSRYGK